MRNTSSDPAARLPGPLALVLSGGGAQGAAQAGAIVALHEAGIRWDLCIGTSVGAWNGAYICRSSAAEHVRGLLPMWLDPEVRRLFRGLLRGFLGALARGDVAAVRDAGIRRILERTCGGLRIEDLAVPLTVAAIDLHTADLVYMDRGDLCEAVRAASAIPSVLPPVRRDGCLLVDAGFVDNYGVSEAIRRGARSVLLIDASVGLLGDEPRSIPAILNRANLVTRIHQRAVAAATCAAADIPLETIAVAGWGAAFDFAGIAGEIARGRHSAQAWLGGEPTGSEPVAGSVPGGHGPGGHDHPVGAAGFDGPSPELLQI